MSDATVETFALNKGSRPSPPAPPSALKLRPISRAMRARKDRLFITICVMATAFSVLTLIMLLGSVLFQGVGRLTWQFVRGVPSSDPALAGVWPAMAGTAVIVLVCALTAVPIGVMTAILLEEYKPRHWFLRRLHLLVQLNITNLAGVPSIVYGILGLTVFVTFFGLTMKNKQTGEEMPFFETGARYYDRFTTVDGYGVMVPVAGAQASATVFEPSLPLIDDAYKPTTATKIDASAEAAAMGAMGTKFDTLQYALEDQIESLRTMDAATLAGVVGTQWTAAGLPGPAPAALNQSVLEAVQKPAREAKRALRAAVKVGGRAAAAAAFPRGVMSDAAPSRVAVHRPWYVRFPFGRSVLACGLTLMLVVLPIIIISTQEAFRAVSDSLRRASLALGATKWQTIWNVTLPSALPGILTGVILAVSRAIGEAAPVFVVTGAIVYITSAPANLMDKGTVLPLQIFSWAGLPRRDFHELAAAGIIILMGVLLGFNLLAIYLRQRAQQKQQH